MSNDSQSPPQGIRLLGIAALAVLVLAGAAAGYTRVWNFDVHAHIACGQWMIENHAILGHDPFSTPDQDHWVNVHWLYHLLVAAVHSIGGFAGLTVLKSLLAATMLVIFVAGLGKHVPRPWLVVSGLVALWIVLGRIRVRPELATLVLLTATIVLVDSVRRGATARRLWALVPIMLLWANFHGLFVLGLGVFWSAVAGAWFDTAVLKRDTGRMVSTEAFLAMLTATGVCLVTPAWPVQSFLHPFLLWTRVSGQEVFYSYAVSELQPTWRVLGSQPVAIGAFVAVAALMAADWRRAATAHVVWLVLFTVLGLTALRNTGLTGPVYGFLLAWYGGQVLTRLSQRVGRTRAIGTVATVASLLLALAATAGFVTEWTFRAKGTGRRFGAGRQEEAYPTAAADFLAKTRARGDVLCLNFGDASAFLYAFYEQALSGTKHPAEVPVRRVWMDGRLEAHSYQRFKQYHQLISRDLTSVENLNSPRVAASLPREVRFYFVSHSGRSQLSAFNQSRRFRLVHVSDAGACFALADWVHGGPNLPAESNLKDFDRPLTDSGGLAGLVPQRRTPMHQNAQPLIYRCGQMFMWLGRQAEGSLPIATTTTQRRCSLLGLRYLTAAAEDEKLAQEHVLTGMLAQAHQQMSTHHPLTPGVRLPADVQMARALYLYRQLDLAGMTPFDLAQFGTQRVAALRDARQFDAAYAATGHLLALLPKRLQVTVPHWFRTMSDGAKRRMDMAEEDLAGLDLRGKGLVEQATAIADRAGLIDRAIQVLRAAPADDAAAQRLLGDLLLRSGRPGDAQAAYTKAMRDDAVVAAGGMHLRVILCDWIEGRRQQAAAKFQALMDLDDDPSIRYYYACLLEQIGRYRQGLDVIDRAKTDDASLSEEIRALHLRLLEY